MSNEKYLRTLPAQPTISKYQTKDAIDELAIISYCIGCYTDWFTPEELQKRLNICSLKTITDCLIHGEQCGFFIYSFDGNKYKFKRKAYFITQ